MLRSTPRKSLADSTTPTKRIRAKTVSASPARHKADHISPPKMARGGVTDGSDVTPTKTFALESLDAALSHYFSPKRKASKSPARSKTTAQKRLNFDDEVESDGESSDDEPENVATVALAPLENLKCDLEQLAHCFSSIDSMLPDPYISWELKLKEQFNYWTQLLRMGPFSLLLHGVGSKRVVLDDFAESLANYPYSVFHCYRAGINCKHIFETLNSELNLDVTHRGISLNEWAHRIRDAIESKYLEFFILIHNIDAPCMRDPQQQRALSILAESKTIHLVATVDHKNATLLWDLESREKFNWLLVRASTLRTYGDALFDAELRSLGLNAKAGGRQHNFASLDVFWQANTEKARKMLQHLAIHAGTAGSVANENSEPLSLSTLCQILKNDFITTSEATLRSQLTEFVDSSIIRIDKEGTILLNVDRNLLVEFLETKTL